MRGGNNFFTDKWIIYVYPHKSSFIEQDINLLKNYTPVKENTYPWNNKIFTPIFLIAQFFFFLFNIWRAKAVFISFGGYWSLIPVFFSRITRKKVYIIINGTDAAFIPELNYGSLGKFPLKYFCKYSYMFATKLLPVSDSLIKTVNDFNPELKYKTQGIKYFFPKLKTPIEVIYNGCDTNFWKPVLLKREPKTFLTVFSTNQFSLKGGDLILNVAHSFPECTFYIAGSTKPSNINKVPINVYFLGKQSKEELRKLYSKTSFYFQLSSFEGFGCSLAEAMLCKAIPIGSKVNLLPKIIDNAGFILERKDVGLLKELLNNILHKNDIEILRDRTRNRIIQTFNLDLRKKKLLTLIS